VTLASRRPLTIDRVEDAEAGRFAVLVLSLWVEDDPGRRLRIRLTYRKGAERETTVVASIDDAVDVVRSWLERGAQPT
jgi:hypothetical protein